MAAAKLDVPGLAVELDLSAKSIRRYASGDATIPKTVEMALRCMVEHRPAARRSRKR